MLDVVATPICLSGGAPGADLQWGRCAGAVGHRVIHWSFAGHRTQAPPEERVILPPDLLVQADPFLIAANRTLKRQFPGRTAYATNLLRRDYFQVAWSKAVYVVGDIEDGMIVGGTAWAVQMFLDRFPDAESVKVYVFDQHQHQHRLFGWHRGWVAIELPPQPHGIWAGIGSRDLRRSGQAEIHQLLRCQGTVHGSSSSDSEG
jgi:hypothetical protein